MNEQTRDTPKAALSSSSKALVAVALLLDLVCVIGFAASGRAQHGETATLVGLWQTAWPFLAGLALLWLLATVWRRPLHPLRSGLPVWVGTVAVGMLLRVVFTDGGAALPFVLVATGTLALGIVGWRLLAALFLHLRSGSKLRASG